MSSIDILNKRVVLTDGGFISSEEWIAELRAEGYEIKDYRCPKAAYRESSGELS